MSELNISENKTSDEINEEQQECEHFRRVTNAFSYYRIHSHKRLVQAKKSYVNLPSHHKLLIPQFCSHLSVVEACIDHNYEIMKLIIAHTDQMFENKQHDPSNSLPFQKASEYDMDRVKTTLQQFVRDWSHEGAEERKGSYGLIIDEVLQRFPPSKCDTGCVSVLVPGAGLGRLAFELAQLGYVCQGNEFSLFMLFASNFILNQCTEKDMFTFYPWVHQFCNNISSADQIRPVTFPDINPRDILHTGNFSMAAGDFLDVYTEADAWDCVATAFFIDTAHNIIAYIETIWKILKPGGYWINQGPLLYHFANMHNETSIELPYDSVMDIIKKCKFKIEKEVLPVTTAYMQNSRSMLKYQYDCAFFVARKPLEEPS